MAGKKDQTPLAERLKALRLEKKLTTKALAQELGLGISTYSNYENRCSEPSYQTMMKIAAFHGTTVSYLLGEKDSCSVKAANDIYDKIQIAMDALFEAGDILLDINPIDNPDYYKEFYPKHYIDDDPDYEPFDEPYDEPDNKPNDPVNHPSHYTTGKIEVIDFITDQDLSYCLGNAVKYIARSGKKDESKTIEDLQKAIWYLEREITEQEAREREDCDR